MKFSGRTFYILVALTIGVFHNARSDNYRYAYPHSETPPFEEGIGYPLERILKTIRSHNYQNVRLYYEIDNFDSLTRSVVLYNVKTRQLFYYERYWANKKVSMQRLRFDGVTEKKIMSAIKAYNSGSYGAESNSMIFSLKDIGCPVIDLETGHRFTGPSSKLTQ